jgi:hypothetical protein
MTVYITNTVKVKPGHIQAYAAWAAKIIPIYEKYGVKFLGTFLAVGGDENRVVYLVSMRDWAAYGNAFEKMTVDAEFLRLESEGGIHFDGNDIQALMPVPGSAMQ